MEQKRKIIKRIIFSLCFIVIITGGIIYEYNYYRLGNLLVEIGTMTFLGILMYL